MIPFEFRRELWCQKTRVQGLSCGIICVILRLAVLIQYRSVTHTHTHTHTHTTTTTTTTTTAYTAVSIASRGKNPRLRQAKCEHFHNQLLLIVRHTTRRTVPCRAVARPIRCERPESSLLYALRFIKDLRCRAALRDTTPHNDARRRMAW